MVANRLIVMRKFIFSRPVFFPEEELKSQDPGQNNTQTDKYQPHSGDQPSSCPAGFF